MYCDGVLKIVMYLKRRNLQIILKLKCDTSVVLEVTFRSVVLEKLQLVHHFCKSASDSIPVEPNSCYAVKCFGLATL